MYVNHRPAFGLTPEKLVWAFDTLGVPSANGSVIERGELLDLLQSKGNYFIGATYLACHILIFISSDSYKQK